MRSFRFRLSLENAARVFDLRPKTCQPVVDEAAHRKRKKLSGSQGSTKLAKLQNFHCFPTGSGGIFWRILNFWIFRTKKNGMELLLPFLKMVRQKILLVRINRL